MKRLAVLAVLLLTGCGFETGQSIDTTALNVVVQKVQDLTVKACSFLPASKSVVAIIAAADPLAMSAVAIADAICAAVTASPAAPSSDPAIFGFGKSEPGPCPMVEGVCVEGQFISKDEAPKEEAP